MTWEQVEGSEYLTEHIHSRTPAGPGGPAVRDACVWPLASGRGQSGLQELSGLFRLWAAGPSAVTGLRGF